MTKYSDFSIGDQVVRRWNNRVYFICHDVDTSKQEFLIDEIENTPVRKIKVCEMSSNLRLATELEIECGYADKF